MSDPLPPDELRRQTLFSTLLATAFLAGQAGIPLREVKQLVELAYYREARRRGLKMTETTELLSVSMSKVGLLSKQLKEHFAEVDDAFGLPRRILKLLWAGPLSEARIARALPHDDPDAIADAIGTLVEEQRVRVVEGRTPRYALAEAHVRLVADPWMARIDALNDLVGTVARAVEARFFAGDERAFARTLAFRVRDADMPRLLELYRDHVFPLVSELDQAADDDETATSLSLSLLWAPTDDGKTGDSE